MTQQASQRLVGRRALVTGSTSGIGKAITIAFAAEGADVVVTGRREALGAAVVAEIRHNGSSAHFIAADLAAGPSAVNKLVADAAVALGGPIDTLVNNAAFLLPSTTTLEVTAAMLDSALTLNIKVPFLVTAAVLPAMQALGGGVIINVGSINGVTGMAGAALYGATKSALHSLTKSWAAEFAPVGIRVNTVAPGPTAVEWSEPFHDVLETMVSRVPSQRLSQPEEIAAAAVFLASAEASHIHGATIPVDGGMSAIWPR
jgi:NAD(P)-dependent dehydrogenase (short-subunit alcohol dehydrogenase family)